MKYIYIGSVRIQRFTHRSLLLSRQGHLKLLDFGLSATPTEQSVPEICGTPAYMAPESFEGYSQEKADIWAIGIITYETRHVISQPYMGHIWPYLSI